MSKFLIDPGIETGPKQDDSPRMRASYKDRLRRLIAERLRRRSDAIALYEPREHDQLPFHKSNARERIARGSNRSGKTLAAAFEVAAIALNRHPYKPRRDAGLVLCVGKDQDHLADVMWTKLAKSSPSLRMIRDEITDEWRAYKPWLDAARFEESRPMGPLIPSRFIKKVTWVNKGRGVPSSVTLTTGWKLLFYTGGSHPPNGLDADGVWFDEEIPVLDWYSETAARLLDRKGWFIWSATPQTGGQALWDLHLRCDKEAGKLNPRCEEFELLLANNPYVDEEEKELLKEKYKFSPEEYRVRIEGKYLMSGALVYPTFNELVHGIDPFYIPETWTRYMVVDPGHVVCAVQFYAVPPETDKEHRGHVYCYDELYIQGCDADTFAARVKNKIGSQSIREFIVDYHGSKRSETGTGQTIAVQYSEALRRHRVFSETTGYGMTPSQGSVREGLEKVRAWLAPIEDGEPKLRVFRSCQSTFTELSRYQKKRVKGRYVDEPDQKKNHLCDTTRYAAMHGLPYAAPRKAKRPPSNGALMLKRKQQRRQDDKGVYLTAGHPRD